MHRAGAIALVLVAFAAGSPARAHPPVGIVMDARGNVFYSDLEHVWKIAQHGARAAHHPQRPRADLAVSLRAGVPAAASMRGGRARRAGPD